MIYTEMKYLENYFGIGRHLDTAIQYLNNKPYNFLRQGAILK